MANKAVAEVFVAIGESLYAASGIHDTTSQSIITRDVDIRWTCISSVPSEGTTMFAGIGE